MRRNLLKAALKPWKAGKYIARAMPELVEQNPEVVLAACRAGGIDTFEARYLDRYRVAVDSAAGIIATDILRYGSFQLDLFQAVSDLIGGRARRFVNVGANMGTTCLNAHHFGFRDFIAFEPVAGNYALLERNLAANLAESRIDCRMLALGSADGTATIQLHAENCGRHSLKSSFNAPANIASEQATEVRTLDSQAVGEDCLLWIDTEGFELEVLQGGRETLRNGCIALCVEITPAVYSGPERAELAAILDDSFSRFFDSAGNRIASPAASEAWRAGEQHDLLCFA